MRALFPTPGDVIAGLAWIVLIALWRHAARTDRHDEEEGPPWV